MNAAWRERIDIAWRSAALTAAVLVFLGAVLHCYDIFSRLGPDLIAPNGMPLGSDFISLWSGGWLAYQGNAPGAYDPATIGAAHKVGVPAITSLTLFHYPPTYLLMMLPLGALPYIPALALFVGLSLVWFAFYLWNARPHWSTALLLLGYPAMWLNILGGQNGFLSGALIGLALMSASPFWQGMGWGLLTYKPQLGLPVPFALLLDRRMKAILWSGIIALGFALLSLLLLGKETWDAFLVDTELAWHVLADGLIPLDRMASAFSAVRHAEGSMAAALVAQGVSAAIGILSTLAVWRSKAAPLRLRQASLITAMVMATPHLFHYDLAILALPLLLLLREGEEKGWLACERLALFVTWLGPYLAIPTAGNVPFNFYPLLLIALQVLILRRVRRYERQA